MANTLGQVDVQVVADLAQLNSQLKQSLGSAAQVGQQIGQQISGGLNASIKQFSGQMGLFEEEARRAATGAGQQFKLFGDQVASISVKSTDALSKLPPSLRDIYASVQQAGQGAAQASSGFETFKRGLQETFLALQSKGEALGKLGSELQSFGGKLSVGVTAPLVALGALAVKSSADVDSLKRGLTAVAGSAGEAEKQFQSLMEVVALPGLGLQEAIQGSVRLQAFGFSATEAKDALKAFGNAIATVGGGRAELDRVIVQLGQMAGAGKVLTQDLRPIIQTVPQVAGIIKQHFGGEALSDPAKRIAELGLTSKEFISILVAELGKLPQVTGGIKNALENFSDSTTIALAKLGDAMAPVVELLLNGLSKALEALVSAMNILPPSAQMGVIAIGALAAAVGPAVYVVGTLAKSISDVIALGARWAEWSSAGAQATAALAKSANAAAAEVTALGAATSVTGGAVTKLGTTAALVSSGALASFAVGLLGIGAAALVTMKQISDLEARYQQLAETARSNQIHEALNSGKTVAELQQMGFALDEVKRAISNVGIEAGSAKTSLDAMVQSGKSMKEIFETGGFKSLDIEDAFRRAAEAAKEKAAAIDTASTAARGLSESLGLVIVDSSKLSVSTSELVKTYGEMEARLGAAKAAVEELTKQKQAGKDVTGALALANKELTAAYKALHPEVKAVAGSMQDLLSKQRDMYTSLANAAKAVDDLTARMRAGEDVTIALSIATKNLERAQADLAANGVVVLSAFDAIAGRATAATMALGAMGDGLGKVALAFPMYSAAADQAASATQRATEAKAGFITVQQNGVDVIMRAADAHKQMTFSMENGVTVIRGSTAAHHDLHTSIQSSTAAASNFGSAASGAFQSLANAASQSRPAVANVTQNIYAAGEAASTAASKVDGVTLSVRELGNGVTVTSAVARGFDDIASSADGAAAAIGRVNAASASGAQSPYSNLMGPSSSQGQMGFRVDNAYKSYYEPGRGLVIETIDPQALADYQRRIEAQRSAAQQLLGQHGYSTGENEINKLIRAASGGRTDSLGVPDLRTPLETVIKSWNDARDATTRAGTAAAQFASSLDDWESRASDAVPTLRDLETQLTRMVQAGQFGTPVYRQLETQLASMSRGVDSSAASATRAAGAHITAGRAVILASDYIEQAAARTVAASTQIQRAFLLDPMVKPPADKPSSAPRPFETAFVGSVWPEQNAPAAYNPHYQITPDAPYFPLSGQPERTTAANYDGSRAQQMGFDLNFYIQPGSAEAIGQQVTQILRSQGGYQ